MVSTGNKLEVEKLTYSLDDASKATGLSKGHLRNQHKLNKLKLIKSGRRTLIRAVDLSGYLDSLSALNKSELNE